MDKHFVYIVKCNDGSLYTGYAKDVNARIIKKNKTTGRVSLSRNIYNEIGSIET
mgnify:CR=1 FL=1